ncbi:carbohydrate ABC transporter permease [Faecalicatena sp. AGMB00832]|uniref:Carbohydrate ABC transporter permease n=1 Tax=Faecalicatena faecalis TaxID=2726362 RepID=A0ABS6D4I7_9FIRM|nr:carbohydrate ABC transporter permease [Faecalicatena faecalis]
MIKRLMWGIIGGFMIFPLLFMVGNSFMGTLELQEAYGAVLGNAGGGVSMRLIPRYPTLRPLVELLMDSPGFFVMFWNSVRQVFGVLAGQAVIGIPAAWAFARYRFRGRRVLFMIYMILMIMPFQVTMVSNYLLLSKLSLMDTHFALILPGVFSTFPVFIMEKFFRAIPETMIEAAKVDGAGSLCIFLKIGLPLGAPGIMAALFLNFLEYWNAIEAPMTFLKTKSKFPLSLYLPDITTDQISIAFAASVVMMIPAVLGFLWGKEYLRMGIAASGLKE